MNQQIGPPYLDQGDGDRGLGRGLAWASRVVGTVGRLAFGLGSASLPLLVAQGLGEVTRAWRAILASTP